MCSCLSRGASSLVEGWPGLWLDAGEGGIGAGVKPAGTWAGLKPAETLAGLKPAGRCAGLKPACIWAGLKLPKFLALSSAALARLSRDDPKGEDGADVVGIFIKPGSISGLVFMGGIIRPGRIALEEK